MNLKYPLIIPTIGHGATDLINAPIITLSTHLISFLSIKFIPIFYRKIILISSSIIHISRDLSIYYSIILHSIWLKFPITAKLYLSFFHTPLHYIKLYKYNSKNFYKQLSLAFITTLFLVYSLQNNYHIKLNLILGDFWWIAPIFSHIIINEFLIQKKYSTMPQISTKLIKGVTII